MPKKIKKRAKRKDEEILPSEEEGGQEILVTRVDNPNDPTILPAEDDQAELGDLVVNIPEHERDAFQEVSHKAANWVDDNRPMALALFVAALCVPLAIFGGYYALQQGEVEDQIVVSQAIELASTPVEGSPELQLFEQNEDFQKPEGVFASRQAKWEAVYAQASKALTEHSSGDLAIAARYAKAGAAYQLGKYDEAIELYNALLKDGSGPLAPFSRLNLALAQAGKGQTDQAVTLLDALGTEDESYRALAIYHKGRVLEAAGKKEEAKKIYHELLEVDPDTTYKADVERRIAIL